MMTGATLEIGLAGVAFGEVRIDGGDGVLLCLDLPEGTPKAKAEKVMIGRISKACKSIINALEGSGRDGQGVAHSMALDFSMALLIEFCDQGWIKSPSKKKRVVIATRTDILQWVKLVWEKYADHIRLPDSVWFSRAELRLGASVIESILQ